MVWRPMPEQHIFLGRASVPIPLDLVPKAVDFIGKRLFLRISIPEILPDTKQALHEEAGFYQVTAVVIRAKGTVSPVRPSSQCGQAPWKRSAFSSQSVMCRRRSKPSCRVIKPRSIPTKMAIRPNPEPPVLTTCSSLLVVIASRWDTLEAYAGGLGSAPLQKYSNVWCWTRLSNSTVG